MQVVLFEHQNVMNFYPITATRPVWELRAGMYTVRERIEAACRGYFKEDLSFCYYCRPELAAIMRQQLPEHAINSTLDHDDDLLLFNGSILSVPSLKDLKRDILYLHNNVIVALYLSKGKYDVRELRSHLAEGTLDHAGLQEYFPIENVDDSWIIPEYLWDLVLANGTIIKKDFQFLVPENNKFSEYAVTSIGEKTHIYIEDRVKIDPQVVFDATKGPIVIQEGVEIHPFTRIEGPCVIGKNVLLLGAKVREGCTIGPHCRIGGEIEDAVFHAFSNKYHDGFIGHAYIGEWVNLGALTTNSDLKNDYSTVHCYRSDTICDTKETKVGCFVGDYSKTSIGSLINTGSVIGVGAMIVHSGRMTPAYTPDFSWFIKNKLRAVKDWGRFTESCRIMMSRRGMTFTSSHEDLLQHIMNTRKSIRDRVTRIWNEALK